MPEQALANTEEAHAISEAEFVKLCEDVYADRYQIYEFNPSSGRRDALLWMLLGCLMSLLSIPDAQQHSSNEDSSSDPYADAICEILQNRMRPPFNPRAYLAELSKKIETDSD